MNYDDAVRAIGEYVKRVTIGKRVGHLVRDLRMRDGALGWDEGFIYWVRFPSGSEDMRFITIDRLLDLEV